MRVARRAGARRLGLPSLVISLAENQRPVAAGLAERGIARWLGHKDEVTEEIIARELSGLIATGLEAWLVASVLPRRRR